MPPISALALVGRSLLVVGLGHTCIYPRVSIVITASAKPLRMAHCGTCPFLNDVWVPGPLSRGGVVANDVVFDVEYPLPIA